MRPAAKAPGGAELELPAVHSLERGLMAAFLGRLEPAARLLGERGVPGRPARFLPGRTLVIVSYQEFTSSPVGPYSQVSVSLPVHLPAGGSEAARGRTLTAGNPAARAPVLLPLLCQSLWNTERVFRDLHFYVAAIPVSSPRAVPYSSGIWGEPAWHAAAGGGAAGRGGRWVITAGDPTTAGGEPVYLTLAATPTGLGFRERRGYRLVSRLGPDVLTDVMLVDAPARLGFGPWRASLALGTDERTEPLRAVLGEKPVCVETIAHGTGSVAFGGPRPWSGGRTGPARGVG